MKQLKNFLDRLCIAFVGDDREQIPPADNIGHQDAPTPDETLPSLEVLAPELIQIIAASSDFRAATALASTTSEMRELLAPQLKDKVDKAKRLLTESPTGPLDADARSALSAAVQMLKNSGYSFFEIKKLGVKRTSR